MRVRLALLPVIALSSLAPLRTAPSSASIATFITRYADGQPDEAIRDVAAIADLGGLRREFVIDAQAWIHQDPAVASRRRAAAAAFLLEWAHARLESDYGRLSDLIEFTCAGLRTAGPPDAFELAWDRASIALASRARARVWLLGPYARLPHQPPRRSAPPPGRSDSPRHLLHALERFPDDPQLRLARIVAWTWGRDDEPVRNSRWHRSPFAEPDREQAAAIVELQPLVDDAVVGAEALVRIGHIHFTLAEYPEALSALERAQARDAADPAIRYLAFFSAGRALEALNRPEEAMARYAKALEIVPGAESAALALATLQFVRDDRDAAVSRLDAIFNRPAAAPDPGRLVGYGSFLHWPALRDAMRAALPGRRGSGEGGR